MSYGGRCYWPSNRIYEAASKQQAEKYHWIICNIRVDGQILSVDLVEVGGCGDKGGVCECVCVCVCVCECVVGLPLRAKPC